ncbi:MAG: hypothetical protein M1833_004079 [Piccolia ochrophora]|nr:MAG: hypothetical protein M1833_004079 [Piccolia ochrophora]
MSDKEPLEVPHVRKEPRPDFSKYSNEKLPEDLQRLIDRDETLYDSLYDGTAPDSTASSVRYAAYATRIRTILASAHRYVAYTSDIGESFRPVAHPWLVRSAYGVSWAYLGGDVAHEGYKAYWRNKKVLHPTHAEVKARWSAVDAVAQPVDVPHGGEEVGTAVSPIDDWRTVVVQRAVFQGLASMGLPAFTIHSIVRYSGRALKDARNGLVRSYAPIGLGLAAVPFLPFIFDKPVEEAVDWTFHKAFETLGASSGGPRKEKEL